MDISVLHAFVTLAENCNFSKAASLLNTTQPNLSKRIKILEKELGFALFERDTHSVELTRAGKSFYSGIVGILGTLEDCIEEARWYSNHEKPVIEIGGNLANIRVAATIEQASSYAANKQLPFEIRPNRRYISANPLDADTSEPFGDALEGKERVSLLFASKRVYAAPLVVTPLYRDPFALYVSQDNEFAHRESVDLRELKDLFFIKTNSYDTFNDRIEEVCLELGFIPKKRMRYFGSMGDMGVQYGIDETCIIPASMESYIAGPEISGLVRLPLTNENAYFEVVAVHSIDDQSDTIQHCIAALKAVTASWPSDR